MELTAPWKDMKLSIDGGVVVVPQARSLYVRFPATSSDVLIGLAETLKGDLAAAQWMLTEEDRSGAQYEAVFTTPSGSEANLLVNLADGRPQARISIY